MWLIVTVGNGAEAAPIAGNPAKWDSVKLNSSLAAIIMLLYVYWCTNKNILCDRIKSDSGGGEEKMNASWNMKEPPSDLLPHFLSLRNVIGMQSVGNEGVCVLGTKQNKTGND